LFTFLCFYEGGGKGGKSIFLFFIFYFEDP